MSTSTVRINKELQTLLRALADTEGSSMQAVLEKALRLYEEKVFWERTNSAYARLKADPKTWKQELDEREQWDVTVADGLEDE